MMISEWKDANGNWLRVVEDKDRARVQLQLEAKGEARIFWFDTPGDFGDFVATMTEVAKEVFGMDFVEILNKKEEKEVSEDQGSTEEVNAI
jgi:hypothetical protein